MPQTSAQAASDFAPVSRAGRRRHPKLYGILRGRGLVDGRVPRPIQKTSFYTDGGVTDLSEVYPKMFVRRHDHATGRDIAGAAPDLDRLSADVNERTALYVDAYQELRDLTDVFRAYVAGVRLAKEDRRLCRAVAELPLSKGEKVLKPLPEFHPSELFITVARYKWRERRQRRWMLQSAISISGGISLRGKQFFKVAAVKRETPVTRALKQELSRGVPAARWQGKSGRHYVAFSADRRKPPRRVPIVAKPVP